MFHRSHFQTDRAAAEHYNTSKRCFERWKLAIEPLLEEADLCNAMLGGDQQVLGDLPRAAGAVAVMQPEVPPQLEATQLERLERLEQELSAPVKHDIHGTAQLSTVHTLSSVVEEHRWVFTTLEAQRIQPSHETVSEVIERLAHVEGQMQALLTRVGQPVWGTRLSAPFEYM